MQKKNKYLRLTPNEKILLINRSLNGESISKICSDVGISRTIFYKWLGENQKLKIKSQRLGKIYPSDKVKKHWRKQKLRKEQEVVRLWLKNPGTTIREIAQDTGISVGGAFNIVKRYKEHVQKEGREFKRYKKKNYIIYTAEAKEKLIERYHEGESIVRIAKEAGISRTIFYKWLKKYGKSGENKEILSRKIPRAEIHWRFIPGVRERVLDIISENPQISLSKLVIEIKNEGKSISRSGLYYILKSMSLTTPQDRLAYSHSLSISDQSYERIGRRQALLAEATNYLPRFAVFTFFSMIVSLVLFNSISRSVEITGDLARQISPTIARVAEKTADGVKKRADGLFEPLKSDQDLGWGVLAVNLPKDTLRSGEKTQAGFGVVDSVGNTVCDADIRFRTKRFENLIATESVGVPSGSCLLQGTSNDPDYIAAVTSANEEGEYKFDIAAQTYEGGRQFEHNFIVSDDSPFEINRSSYPSRVFPAAIYPVEVKIKANEDFSGTISEVLPEGITASQISDQGILYRKIDSLDKIIKWDVEFKKGETYKIIYTLHFPQVWPEFYEIGPIELVDRQTGAVIYREARYWQIAADAVE